MAKNIFLSIIAAIFMYVAFALLYDRNIPNYGCSFSEQLSFFNRIILLDFDRSSELARLPQEDQKAIIYEMAKMNNAEAVFNQTKLIFYVPNENDALYLATSAQMFCNEKLPIITETSIIYLPDSLELHHIKCGSK